MTNDDFEEEFRKLTAELAGDSSLQMEDDSYHLEGKRLCVALVLAPLDNAAALSQVLTLLKTPAPVVRVDRWTAAYLEVQGESSEDDEIAGMLTGQRPVPPEVDAIARTISKLSKYGSIAMVSWLAENDGFEPGVSGLVTAKRYIAGEPKEDMAAGVLLGGLDDRVEDLLLGRKKPQDYEEGDDSPRGFFGRGRKS